jgi:hypothetical protein
MASKKDTKTKTQRQNILGFLDLNTHILRKKTLRHSLDLDTHRFKERELAS